MMSKSEYKTDGAAMLYPDKPVLPSTKEAEYPYQRLFNAVHDTTGIPMVEELDRIIKIVHEDFPMK